MVNFLTDNKKREFDQKTLFPSDFSTDSIASFSPGYFRAVLAQLQLNVEFEVSDNWSLLQLPCGAFIIVHDAIADGKPCPDMKTQITANLVVMEALSRCVAGWRLHYDNLTAYIQNHGFIVEMPAPAKG
ncbi:hypothetical protein [Thalassomonas actiniarum]|uniref:Uncharacterized protein n=1 Tax=Thalassomonas actiniarum TaxID=485447 RepID=A0AAE9YU97_9GAMM|nr:hypothetical protein [Thalassomonas actiniarum]WDE00757.1 hypothetical protein SG35_009050 [Thalassomonas actiniarum]